MTTSPRFQTPASRSAALSRPTALALAAISSITGLAAAQSASGTLFVNVSCSTGTTHNFSAADTGSLSRSSQCFDQFGGPGIASTNNAGGSWAIGGGGVFFDVSTSSDFVFIGNNQGGGDSGFSFNLSASDLVFSNIANPGQTGGINVGGMHYRFGGQVSTQGVSNCSISNPRAAMYFEFGAGACNGFGGYTLDREFTGGSIVQGAMIGYPNDSSMVDGLSTGGGTSLAIPYSFLLHVTDATSVLYCNGLPTGFGAAHAVLRWQFPCGTPVFDLSPGYTANSAQLGIVNNIWGGFSITQQPASQAACGSGSASFAAAATGSGPLSYRWQVQDAGAWVDLADGNGVAIGPSFSGNTQGSGTSQLTVGSMVRLRPHPNVVQFRCAVTNPCGGTTSNPAALTLNSADFNGDGDIGTDADIEAFFACLGGTCCPTCGSADFNGDGDVGTDADIESFFRVLGGGSC